MADMVKAEVPGAGPTRGGTLRPVWVGTSWKMTKLRHEAVDWVDEVLRRLDTLTEEQLDALDLVRPFVLPAATALADVNRAVTTSAARTASSLLVGAQNAHWDDAGPWTGEVSVPQVADAGARLVELGHSERREHFGETDATVALRARAVLRHHLVPVVCVGETASVRAAGGAVGHVSRQVAASLDGVDASNGLQHVVVAYEPVWAIGTGGRPAEPDDVAPVFAALADRWGGRVTALLYGGSVDRDNAADLLAVPGVDGLFAGRSAWTAEGFVALVRAGRGAVQAKGSSGP